MPFRSFSVIVCAALLVVGCASGGPAGVAGDGGGSDGLAADAGPDGPQGKDFWEECTDAIDCRSQLCFREQPSDPTGRCTIPCEGTCPDGYECKTIKISDAIELNACVPAEETFCRPCDVNRDCGDSSDLCVQLTGGRFCSIDCSQDPTVCPAGFTCQQVEGQGDFANAKQCMPLNGVCCIDADGDLRGVGGGCVTTDCDDANPKVYDDAIEVCDGFDNDCQGGVDVGVTDCAGADCNLGPFGYYEVPAAECVGGRCTSPASSGCGLYTCAAGGDVGEACADACDGEDDAKCVPSAHCDASACVADLPNGQTCDESSDCQSGHCQNGFCCATGDCCAVDTDCPTYGTAAPVCEDPATCQGRRGEVMCSSFQCVAVPGGIADDSGCGPSTRAHDCGWYKPIFCTGAVSQTPPVCPTSCLSNADCDPGAFCDPVSNTCREDLNDGQACGTDPERCKSGHCQNGYCCAYGDCCASEADCPASYTSAPRCVSAATCQGQQDIAQCVNSMCTTSYHVDNDSACGPTTLADGCGPYRPIFCNGQVTQTPPSCPTSCAGNADCDVDAYCNVAGRCVPDEPNGGVCDENGDCLSGHCQNGFCCDGGDCCRSDGDCAAYTQPPVCRTISTCQGTQVVGRCTATFQCETATIDNDAGCVGLKSNECGPYPPVYCTAMTSQPSDQAGLCATTCTSDADCDASAHCNTATRACEPDVGKGGYCTTSNDCQAGYSCVDNVCCTSSCTGTCRRCDLAGSVGDCAYIPDGQDPDGECGAVSCVGYYAGWSGDACYRKADVSAVQASCGGDGMCRTQAEECGAQTAVGPVAVSCDPFCQDPNLASCTGTTAGSCTNVNPGNQTCGEGVCQVTVALCENGAAKTCTPNWGAASTETCNDIDDDCNGTIDDGAFGDWAEPNGSCSAVTTLLEAGSDQGWIYSSLTLYPAGDSDYFRARLTETDDSCGCGLSTDEDYWVVVTLKVPANAGSYRVCMSVGSCSLSNCATVLAGQSGIVGQFVDGGCPGSDAYDLYMRVEPWGGVGFECTPYELTYVFDSGYCR